MAKKKKIPLWGRIFIGLAAGVMVGAIMKEKAHYLKPIGTMFITAVKMLIVPLIFSSLVSGVTSLDDLKKLGRIGGKTLLVYLVTTACAITLGLLICVMVKPGVGVSLAAASSETAATAPAQSTDQEQATEPKPAATAKQPSLVDTIVDMIPSNPIQAMADGNVLQIILFAILLGVSINLVGEPAAPVKNFCDALAEIMYALTSIIMEVAPIGVFALMAGVVAQYGLQFLLPLLKVVVTMYVVCLLHIVIVYGFSLSVICRLNPMRFLKGFLDATMVAFSTSSSSAALPVSMQCCQENLGVPEDVASLVLPLGATINMNGTAIYQGICVVFIAQAYGVELTFSNYITVIMTSILAAVGTAGIPGAGLVMLSMVLTSIGLPLEGIALVAGIDRILDMARSTVNVMGDALAAVMVSVSEKELDNECYNTIIKE